MRIENQLKPEKKQFKNFNLEMNRKNKDFGKY